MAGTVLSILLGLAVGGCGLFSALAPGRWWRIFERWKTDGAQRPTARYLRLTARGGALLTVLAVVWLALAAYGAVAGK